MDITLLGKGCSRCESTIQRIEREANKLGVPVSITKITDAVQITEHGVIATPAVMINGKIVHSGGIPTHEEVREWFAPKPLSLLQDPTRHLFFTGKGGD